MGNEYARRHIEAARRLSEELGGTDADVKEYFFSLPAHELRPILRLYEQKHGDKAREYAERTIEKWRTGSVHMSGMVAERLFGLLPPRMPLADKYRLVENLWNHVGPRSKKALLVGLDVSIEEVLAAVRTHMENVIVHYKIPQNLEKRFAWLAAGDSHVKQDLLNHLQQYEKTLVVEGARLQLPVMLEHLKSQTGQHTHRLAQILKIGNHELELSLDRSASGVSLVEPWATRPSALTQTQSYGWLLWVVIALVMLYLAMHG